MVNELYEVQNEWARVICTVLNESFSLSESESIHSPK